MFLLNVLVIVMATTGTQGHRDHMSSSQSSLLKAKDDNGWPIYQAKYEKTRHVYTLVHIVCISLLAGNTAWHQEFIVYIMNS